MDEASDSCETATAEEKLFPQVMNSNAVLTQVGKQRALVGNITVIQGSCQHQPYYRNRSEGVYWCVNATKLLLNWIKSDGPYVKYAWKSLILSCLHINEFVQNNFLDSNNDNQRYT